MYTLLDLTSGLWLAWAIYWTISSRRVQKTKVGESRRQRLQHILPLALGFALIFRGLPSPVGGPLNFPFAIKVLGVIMTALGLGFAVWARIHLGRYWSGTITLKEDHQLIRSGPYGFVRHPIYTGILSAILGSALTAATWPALVAVALTLATFDRKLRREERLLIGEFGDHYRRFQREVRRLIPYLY